MVEEPSLPYGRSAGHFCANAFCRPFFPLVHESRKRPDRAGGLFGAEEMNVVRHDNEATDEPTVPLFGRPPFAHQYGYCFWLGQE